MVCSEVGDGCNGVGESVWVGSRYEVLGRCSVVVLVRYLAVHCPLFQCSTWFSTFTAFYCGHLPRISY